MAAITPDGYIDLDLGSGLNDGSSWANAYQTMSAAMAGITAGDIFFISHDCQEVFSADTEFNFPTGAPCAIISVDKDASDVYTPQSTTPQLTTSTNNNILSFGGNGSWIGVYVLGGQSLSIIGGSANEGLVFMEECVLEWSTTAANRQAFSIVALAQGHFKNCTLINGSTDSSQINAPYVELEGPAQLILEDCDLTADTPSYIDGSIFELGTNPTDNATLIIRGGSCSTFTSAASIFEDNGAASQVDVDGMRLPTGVTMWDTLAVSRFPIKNVARYSANTYSLASHIPEGDCINSATNIRTGGAEDDNAGYSIAVTTDATCQLGCEVRTPWFYIPVTSTGSKTVDVFINSDDVLTDTQCWLELIYMDTASSAEMAIATTRNTDIVNASGTTLTSDTSTWTTNNNRYKLSDTITVNATGLLGARVCFAVDLTDTCYVDPFITVT